MTEQEKQKYIEETINRIFGGGGMPVPSREDEAICEANRISKENQYSA